MQGQGKIIVLSAPSGAGKTTIAHEILKRNPSLRFSISATTRIQRANEVDGRDYFFLTPEVFRRRVAAGEFVEWEEIYGNLYGTLKTEVDAAIAGGQNILFDVDVRGGLSIKKCYADALLIFLRPPSVEVLLQRLRDRSTENAETLARRMDRVPMELELGERFDHQIVNDDLTRAIGEVQHIVTSHLAL